MWFIEAAVAIRFHTGRAGAPMNAQYEVRNNYLFLKMTGPFDVKHSNKIIYEITEKLLTNNLTRVFLDVTDVTGIDESSTTKLYNLSSLMSQSFLAGTKVSLLETKEQIDNHSLFEDVLANRGYSVKVTAEREEGLKWLGAPLEEES
jgi:anti-anti-sigma regulatory factor